MLADDPTKKEVCRTRLLRSFDMTCLMHMAGGLRRISAGMQSICSSYALVVEPAAGRLRIE